MPVKGHHQERSTEPEAPLARARHLLGAGASISEARHHAAAFLDRARADNGLDVSDRASDIVQLVVSELVTNAYKYAPGPVRLELRLTAHAVDIVVRDGDPTVPAARTADPRRVGQHGLEIVSAVSEALEVAVEPHGKSITARIALSDAPTRA
ncbi:ATPase [Streptomyces zinciresistens K42]|uniref:ATPase n=1 Tax=Streptomyces zinciresistens K42 TaxID=700597 RepID=G2GEC3_9ACTN|nr:ATPase [Streptomyces zinciresistens K42]